MQALLARGHEVVGFDPLFVGESLDPRDPVPHRPEAVHFETYNPSLAADQMQDLATVLAWCRARTTCARSTWSRSDTAGYQALVARPVLEGLARTVIELSRPCPSTGKPPTSGRRRSTCPAWSSSAGPGPPPPSSAPAPLWLYGNTETLDTSWAKAAYELAGALLDAADRRSRARPRRDRALGRSRRMTADIRPPTGAPGDSSCSGGCGR